MFRSLLLLPALLGLYGSVAASTIRGTVSGPENKPFEFAVVTLLSANDSSLVKGGVTDAAGAFSLENISGGSYLLTVSFTGYTKVSHGPFTLSGDTDYVVPAIALLANKEMNAVTIFSTAPLFQQKPGMLVMNVEGSPVRIAETAWDLLYKVPGVFIDQNNNISLKGKSGTTAPCRPKPELPFTTSVPFSSISTAEACTPSPSTCTPAWQMPLMTSDSLKSPRNQRPESSKVCRPRSRRSSSWFASFSSAA